MRRRGRATGRLGATLAGGVALALVSCGGGGGSDHATTPPAWCEPVVIAHQEAMAPADLTFEDLVAEPAWDVEDRGAAAAAVLLGVDVDGSPFGDLFEHLEARIEADRAGSDLPEAPAAVRRAARRLDRSLADGTCE